MLFFANSNHINFNCRKIVFKQFDGKTNDCKLVMLDSTGNEWVSEIKHLGNLNISFDCQIKTSHFINYVNKLIVDFGHLRCYVLNKLLKFYCCLFNGSQM